MTKILITGGDGFIAKSLNDSFSSDYEIDLCNRQKLDLLDTRKVYNYLKENKFDAIIHSATYDAAPDFSDKDPDKVLHNNLAMFYNLARCEKYFGKMIYFGSGSEFGRENWKLNMGEDHFDKHVPLDWPYGFSKYIMSKYTLSSNNIYNLRVFGLFGEYDDWRYRVISNFCCKAVLGLPIVVKKNVLFDFVYINDLCKVVEWVIDNNPKYNIYNVCNGVSHEYKKLAQKVIDISGKKLDLIIEDEDLTSASSGNNSRLLSELDGFKFTSIDESIKEIYNYYNENIDVIKKEQFMY
jgi:GDP-L-fucose synthase